MKKWHRGAGGQQRQRGFCSLNLQLRRGHVFLCCSPWILTPTQVCLYITVMNTNTFGSERFITTDIIRLCFKFQFWLKEAVALLVLNLLHSFSLRKRLFHMLSFHSSCQQMGVLQDTVHSLCLLQLWFQMSSLWCLHSWFSCRLEDIAAGSFYLSFIATSANMLWE